jgi:pyruvate dehydrogenase E1 component
VRDIYTIPFYLFYSMFGFQRIGDLIWAAGDAGVKGFMIGGIAGRTSLSGEGLQHADGQSHLYAMAYPNICAYDPAFAFELAVIVRDGIKRMYKDGEEVMYYITIANQGYPMPKKPANVDEGIIKGIYLYKKSRKRKNKSKTVNLLGSGALMEEIIEAAQILEKEYDLPANIWSVTSYKALYDDAVKTETENMSRKNQRRNFIQKNLGGNGKVFVAATDYLKAMPLSIAKWIPGHFEVLGTDGFGVSDGVDELREHFNVNASRIVRSALAGLVNQDKLNKKVLEESMTG